MGKKTEERTKIEEALRTGAVVSVEPMRRSSRAPALQDGIPESLAHQVVGNIGLYYVCYCLSRRGWNVMPTSRNAKGIDLLIYSQDASRTRTVQVKALSKASPVPLGRSLDHLFGDFFIICRDAVRETPVCFVLTPDEVRGLVHRGVKDGRVSYWLQPKAYAVERYREAWERIGSGLSVGESAVQARAVLPESPVRGEGSR